MSPFRFAGTSLFGFVAAFGASGWLLWPVEAGQDDPFDCVLPTVRLTESKIDLPSWTPVEPAIVEASHGAFLPARPTAVAVDFRSAEGDALPRRVVVLDDGRMVNATDGSGAETAMVTLAELPPRLSLKLTGEWTRTVGGDRLWRLEAGADGAQFVERSLATGDVERAFDCKVSARSAESLEAALSPDGRYLAFREPGDAGTSAGRIAVWDANAGRFVRHVALPADAAGGRGLRLAFRENRLHVEGRSGEASKARLFHCSPEAGDFRSLGE